MEHFRDSTHQVVDVNTHMMFDSVSGVFVNFRVNYRKVIPQVGGNMKYYFSEPVEIYDWSFFGSKDEAIRFVSENSGRYIAIEQNTIQRLKM